MCRDKIGQISCQIRKLLLYYDMKNFDLDDIINSVNDDHVLVLINDDNNSFEHVIACLQELCDHGQLQAGQCALLTDKIGECEIKRGDRATLKSIQQLLIAQGLHVKLN